MIELIFFFYLVIADPVRLLRLVSAVWFDNNLVSIVAMLLSYFRTMDRSIRLLLVLFVKLDLRIYQFFLHFLIFHLLYRLIIHLLSI